MALDTQLVVIGNNATKTLVVGKDASGNIAPAHVIVGADGTERGIQASPLYVAVTAQPTDAAVGAKLDAIAANTSGVATAAGQASALAQATATATALGAPADAAWSSGAGSVVALLKGLCAKLGGTLTVAWSGQTVGITGTVAVQDAAAESSLATIATNTASGPTATGQASALTQATVTATALGAPADTAWASGGGSVVALLKAAIAAIKGTLTISAATLPLPTGAAQDGTDATGITPPTGATGLRGWASASYGKLTSIATSLAGSLSVTVSNLPATQAITAAALPLPTGAALDGTDATGVTPPSGAVGMRGWLSGIFAGIGTPADAAWGGTGSGTLIAISKALWGKLAGVLTVTLNGMLPAGTNFLGTVGAPLAPPITGQVKIVTTGTAVQLPSAALVNGITVTAKASNAAQVGTYSSTIGASSALTTLNDGTGPGYPLAPGGSISFSSANANQIWINGTAGDVFAYAAG